MSVSLASSHLCCLCSSVSQNRNCARLLIVATPCIPALKAPSKVAWQQFTRCTCKYCTRDNCGHTNKQMQKMKSNLRTGKCFTHGQLVKIQCDVHDTSTPFLRPRFALTVEWQTLLIIHHNLVWTPDPSTWQEGSGEYWYNQVIVEHGDTVEYCKG